MAHRPARTAERAGRKAGPPRSSSRMFVLAVPGLAALVKRELAALPGVTVKDVGNDGRSDVVLCEVEPGREQAVLALRTIEDAFVELGRTLRAEGDKPHWIARRILRPARLASSVRIWRGHAGGGAAGGGGGGGGGGGRRHGRPGALTYRVVARVLQERSWQRTQLRRALDDAVSAAEPSWRTADPAQLELWALEYTRGRFVAGVRLTTARMRQHGGRATERPGALRPTVAAAMVALAGPEGAHGTLLDPCCGSGTILAEATSVGWAARGRDIDPSAVSASRRNVSRVEVEQADVRELDLTDASVDTTVSNLPFGRQYDVQGEPRAWLTEALAELARVTRPGGRVVLLVPDLPKAVLPPSLRLLERHTIRLLGTSTTIWAYERR